MIFVEEVDVFAFVGTEFTTEHCLPDIAVSALSSSMAVEALFRAIVDTRNAKGEHIQGQRIQYQLGSTGVRTESCLVSAFADLVVIVKKCDHLVAEPRMAVFAYEQRITEQLEVVIRIAISLGEKFHLVRNLIDAQRGIEAGDLQGIERLGTSASDLAYEKEVVLADALSELMDHRTEQASGSGIHVFDRVDAISVNVSKGDPELV